MFYLKEFKLLHKFGYITNPVFEVSIEREEVVLFDGYSLCDALENKPILPNPYYIHLLDLANKEEDDLKEFLSWLREVNTDYYTANFKDIGKMTPCKKDLVSSNQLGTYPLFESIYFYMRLKKLPVSVSFLTLNYVIDSQGNGGLVSDGLNWLAHDIMVHDIDLSTNHTIPQGKIITTYSKLQKRIYKAEKRADFYETPEGYKVGITRDSLLISGDMQVAEINSISPYTDLDGLQCDIEYGNYKLLVLDYTNELKLYKLHKEDGVFNTPELLECCENLEYSITMQNIAGVALKSYNTRPFYVHPSNEIVTFKDVVIKLKEGIKSTLFKTKFGNILIELNGNYLTNDEYTRGISYSTDTYQLELEEAEYIQRNSGNSRYNNNIECFAKMLHNIKVTDKGIFINMLGTLRVNDGLYVTASIPMGLVQCKIMPLIDYVTFKFMGVDITIPTKMYPYLLIDLDIHKMLYSLEARTPDILQVNHDNLFRTIINDSSHNTCITKVVGLCRQGGAAATPIHRMEDK